MIHLGGPGIGDLYARQGSRTPARGRCGGNDVGPYLARANSMKRLSARLAADD